MAGIKSINDLKKLKEKALNDQQLAKQQMNVEVIVGMGTPGIAAGARETVKAILKFVEDPQSHDHPRELYLMLYVKY